MKYWVFHAEMLAKALGNWEAERQRAGASEQQAKDDMHTVLAFLGSAAAANEGLANDDGHG